MWFKEAATTTTRTTTTWLRFVDTAHGDDGNLLGPSALASEVCDPVDDLEVGHDVAKDAGELVAHVGQDDAELRSNLQKTFPIHLKRFVSNLPKLSKYTFYQALVVPSQGPPI